MPRPAGYPPPSGGPIRAASGLAAIVVLLVLETACAGRIDRFTVDKLLVSGGHVADTGKACGVGVSLVHPLHAASNGKSDLALTTAEATSALCAEKEAWEAELDALRAGVNAPSAEARAAEITDATLRAERAHALAGARFDRAFLSLEREWGPVGDTCPKIEEKDEIVYVVGLMSGTLALLHDRASGGVNGIPLDRLAIVARGSVCVDDASWWWGPAALRAVAWATVPGLGPEGTDPWEELESAADQGDTTGVRVARAMQVLIAANAGRDDLLRDALAAHAAALVETPADPEWLLMDTYAYEIALHQSDRVWTAATGHRTEHFGRWPDEPDPNTEPLGPDPFATDPFEETP